MHLAETGHAPDAASVFGAWAAVELTFDLPDAGLVNIKDRPVSTYFWETIITAGIVKMQRFDWNSKMRR